MRYIASTFGYVFKNFIFIFVFALIPSYFLTAASDLHNMGELIDVFVYGNGNADFFAVHAYFSPFSRGGWAYALVAFASMVLLFPFLLGFIEKHMRLGFRNWKGIAGRFNFNFLTTLVVFAVDLVIYEVWALIASGLIYAETLIFQGIASVAIAVVLAIVSVALLCYIFSLFLLWLPCLQIMGYNFMDSLSYSNTLYAKKRAKLFWALFVPCVVCYVGRTVTVAFRGLFAAEVAAFLICELIFMFAILYVCVLMFVAYFDAAGEERLDLKKKF